MTKKEMYNYIATKNANDADIVAFCTKEIATLEKRSSSKSPTKTQKENAILMDAIVEALSVSEEGMTVTELINSTEPLNGLSNQKVSSLLRLMVEASRVNKEMKGKKAVFSVPR